jgi:hypothetical protein
VAERGGHSDTEFNYVLMFDPDHKRSPFSLVGEAERVQSNPIQFHNDIVGGGGPCYQNIKTKLEFMLSLQTSTFSINGVSFKGA